MGRARARSGTAVAIIQTIDDDIRCDGTDGAHTKDFRDSVSAALEVTHPRCSGTGSPAASGTRTGREPKDMYARIAEMPASPRS